MGGGDSLDTAVINACDNNDISSSICKLYSLLNPRSQVPKYKILDQHAVLRCKIWVIFFIFELTTLSGVVQEKDAGSFVHLLANCAKSSMI